MYDLYLTYTEYRTGGEPDDPSDRWTWHEPEYIDWHPTGIYAEREGAGMWGHGLHRDEIFGDFEKGDVGHLVVVRYTTGSTFGSQHGYWGIIGFYKNADDAVAVEKSIDDDTYEGYTYWKGYFERLEGVEIHTMVVQ